MLMKTTVWPIQYRNLPTKARFHNVPARAYDMPHTMLWVSSTIACCADLRQGAAGGESELFAIRSS